MDFIMRGSTVEPAAATDAEVVADGAAGCREPPLSAAVVAESPTEEVATDAEDVQQEATEETEASKTEREEAKKTCNLEWMSRARSTCSDCEWPGEPCDTEEAKAIAELVCEATRAGTTTHCFVGAKRRLEAEQVPTQPKYEPMDEDESEATKEETPKGHVRDKEARNGEGRGRGKGAGKDKGRLEQPPIRILAARGGGEGAERHTRTLEH